MEQRLASELFHFYLRESGARVSNTVKSRLTEYARDMIVIRTGDAGRIITFQPRFVDAVELGLKYKKSRVTRTDNGTSGTRTVTVREGAIASALAIFPFGTTLEEWRVQMESDPEAESKIAFARKRFTRSMGQFRRHEYESFPRDYKFITTVDDDLAMFIGFHRMYPVSEARGMTRQILADKPMCLQLEVLMRGY